VPRAEGRHPRDTNPAGVSWCRVVAQECQRDVPVQAGEQVQHAGMESQHDRPELVLHVALVPDQPLPVTGQRTQLGQQRRGRRERAPMPVLVAQRVGQHERVEGIRLTRREPVTLPRPGRHLRRHTEQSMALLLQRLDQQPFGALDRDPLHRAMPMQSLSQPTRPGDVVGELALMNHATGRIEDAELVMGVAPVQPDEHPVSSSRFDFG